ncbi:tetratricopeptide repeat protein [Fluviispira vulneris]|uniref:tetratricopeptide repeat protein n=1 Tax=Fluviispira vulneris TaxID=2763012 RepID=UPI0016446C5E|nr:tetratricopeptide repeat protein [Fluviispira vulneris]
MRKLIIGITFLSILINISSCRGNILSSFADQDYQEQAEIDMQNGDYTSAQTKLLNILTTEPNNYTVRSLLAACYAAQGGIIIYQVLSNALTSSSSYNINTNPFGFTSSILPNPTAYILGQMQLAIDSMSLIPAASMTSDMQFVQSMFINLYLLLQLEDLLTLLRAGTPWTAAQTTLVVNTYNSALSSNVSSTNPITQLFSVITTGISLTPGATQAQQIQNFLTVFE